MRWSARCVVASFVMLVVAILPSTPAFGMDSGNDRGVFANAGWDLEDAVTGASSYRIVEASGPRDPSLGPALVSVFGSDYLPMTCADGTEGVLIVDVGAEGPGTVTVTPPLTGATLEATLDLTTTRTNTCTGTTSNAIEPGVSIALALSPGGPVRTETTGTFQLLPSQMLARQQVHVRVRSATGSVTIGAQRLQAGWAEFGRIHGIWHVNSRLDAPATLALHVPRGMDAIGTERGAQLRAAGIWERSRGLRMDFATVDVITLPDGTPSVLAGTYAARPITCEDGSAGLVETFASDEAEGTLRIGPRYRDAAATATLTFDVQRSNGCTGEVRTWVRPDVEVTLALVADGPVGTTTSWTALRTPSLQNARAWVRMRARSANGSFTIGGVTYEPTSWGVIGEMRWRIRGV